MVFRQTNWTYANLPTTQDIIRRLWFDTSSTSWRQGFPDQIDTCYRTYINIPADGLVVSKTLNIMATSGAVYNPALWTAVIHNAQYSHWFSWNTSCPPYHTPILRMWVVPETQ